jgi:hypothetical protein
MILHPHIPKRKKRKPNAQQRALASEWEQIVKKYEPKKPVMVKAQSLLAPKPYVRETPKYPSLNTGNIPATKKKSESYTGDKVLGIATLHKSNAVPVFNSQEAVDISKMRR